MSNGSSWRESTGTTTGMRRRQGVGTAQNSDEAIANGQDSGFLRTASKFDMYAKVDEDLQVKTETGAAVTIGFWLLMVVLVIGEIQAYLKEKPAIERVVVDNTMGQRLRINANITFHAVPCLDVHVDAMDVAGENQLDIDHDMIKQRLSPTGEDVGEPFTEVPGEGDKNLEVDENYCGSCYGAKPGCCNTCKEVADAYSTKGWALRSIRKTAEQCVRDNHMLTPVVEGEGCRLSGSMTVNRVSGNFHVAAGEGVMRDGRHIHLYNADEAMGFNSSHTIHQLSFGETYPGMRPNPLDSTSRVIDEDLGTGLFQYFIKLVPTIHYVGPEDGGGEQKALSAGDGGGGTVTSQFAYTYKFRSLKGATEYHHDSGDDVPHHHVAHGEDQGGSDKSDAKKSDTPTVMLLPGVFFVYDMSPFMVEVTPPATTPFSHLLIRLCAVAGGAFAVAGIVDSAVFYVSNRLRRHGLLGQ